MGTTTMGVCYAKELTLRDPDEDLPSGASKTAAQVEADKNKTANSTAADSPKPTGAMIMVKSTVLFNGKSYPKEFAMSSTGTMMKRSISMMRTDAPKERDKVAAATATQGLAEQDGAMPAPEKMVLVMEA